MPLFGKLGRSGWTGVFGKAGDFAKESYRAGWSSDRRAVSMHVGARERGSPITNSAAACTGCVSGGDGKGF